MQVSQQFDGRRRVGHEVDAGRVAERLAVAGVDPLPRRDALGQHRELRAADRGEQVAEPVVEADLGVLVVRHRLARLRREVPRVRDERRRRPASTPPPLVVMILLPLNDRAASGACGPGAPAVGRAEGLGGVLDQDDVVPRAHRRRSRRSRSTAVEVDGDHRPDAATGALRAAIASSSRLGSMFQLSSQSTKSGRGADVDDRVGGGGEGQREHGTSSPGPTPRTTSARWSAAVPLESARALRAPVAAANSASNASTCGPSGAIQFESRRRAAGRARRRRGGVGRGTDGPRR